MRQTVLLIGGVCGIGKSTLASGVKQLCGDDCYNFDFGTAYEHNGSHIPGPEHIPDWKEQIYKNINRGLDMGFGLVVVNSKFDKRAKRDFAMECVGNRARTLPIILRQPLLTAFHQLKRGRPEYEFVINGHNARQSLIGVCNRSVQDDQSDILLPSNKDMMPKEYLAILNRSELNRPLLNQNGIDPRVRWVAVPYRITPNECIEIVKSGVEGAYGIRDVIEGRNLHRSIETC